jgi:Putative beta-barrel porin-2, OmpL-like. bbp2
MQSQLIARSACVAAMLAAAMSPVLRAQTTPERPAAEQRSQDELEKQMEALKARMAELESELKNKKVQEQAKPASETGATAPASSAAAKADSPAPAGNASPADAQTAAKPSPARDASGTPLAEALPPSGGPQAQALPPATPTPTQEPAPATPTVDLDTPFAYADYTWMNSVPRNHDEVLDSKYFTGEFRVDTNYMYDDNHPIDHTLIGTTEGERTGEFIIQALNIGGDFHAGNMQGRILTQFGAVSTAVPRNDSSYSQGQWDLADAYRYLAEMYAGYHINFQHGLNIQVGDFLSYIGLFSYYSFDNWAYQPSYVSSNTPWFFTGMRVQWFPTNKLKIEPWLINGWQTYAKYNGRQGVGGQILWRPTPNLDFVFNTYALGRDVLGNNKRSRYHEDDSLEWKYYENPGKLMHRSAFSLTWDYGCETGGGVSCMHGNAAAPSQNFTGVMAYHRWWFDHDKFGATIGGGVVNNPGRYLVLLPPINGANATTGSPYFTENPGDKFRGYDFQATFDYMPSQWVTWRVEFTQRGANVPYFAGSGGITPQVAPGVYQNTGDPTQIVPGFTPDLVKQERRWIFALMVKL